MLKIKKVKYLETYFSLSQRPGSNTCVVISYLGAQHIWMFPKIGVPQNGWFIMEHPFKMGDLGGKPTIFGNIHISFDLSI